MTLEELIGYCRYYKGEKEDPYKGDGSSRSFFWFVERMYVDSAVHDSDHTWCKGWEFDVQCYIDTHPNEKNIYTDKNVSIHTKGIAYYIEMMSAKWIPYGPNKIFEY